MKQDKMKENRN